jgi:hypothetical protein
VKQPRELASRSLEEMHMTVTTLTPEALRRATGTGWDEQWPCGVAARPAFIQAQVGHRLDGLA